MLQVKAVLIKQYEEFEEKNSVVIEKIAEADLISARDMYNETLLEEEDAILEAKQLRRHNKMSTTIRLARDELGKQQFRAAQDSFDASS